jgi:hypothetical protein
MSALPLPLPPANVEFTPENLRKYSMLRPQYEYDGRKSFLCSRPREGPTKPSWMAPWPGPMRWENFYDEDPRHAQPEDEDNARDWHDFSDLEAEERARYYYDSEDECYEPLSVREALHRHMPNARPMRWLSRSALLGVL